MEQYCLLVCKMFLLHQIRSESKKTIKQDGRNYRLVGCPVPLERVPRLSRHILVKEAQGRSVYLSSMSSRLRVNNGDWVCPDKR